MSSSAARVPRLIIIGGPNGSGKTTLSEFLRSLGLIQAFVNADIIAQGLSVTGEGASEIQAGRAMLGRIQQLLEERADIAFETTLSGKSWQSLIKKAKKLGYEIFIYFLTIDTPEKAFLRVENRYKEGGHFIPKDTVTRRYYRAHSAFWNTYRLLADEWTVFDNSEALSIEFLSKDSQDSENLNEFLRRTKHG